MGWVSAVTSVAAARQASATGKFNQAVANRNAAIKEQEVEAIQSKKEYDLAKFDERFKQFQGESITNILTSNVELSGSGLRILRYNAEQAELEKDMISYNAEIQKSRAFEEANFARIQGQVARQQAKQAEYGYYAQAGQSLLKAYG